ncbi:MAG: MFS transporter [Planctomycetes bacterium]|nr:MFS transporter [Planctomycetota bacterium]
MTPESRLLPPSGERKGNQPDPPLAAAIPSGDIPHAERNFTLLASYFVIIRCGWIFKTESIIMPIVLDLLGGGAWTRSFLPMLNRFGQSVPPLIMARRIKILPRKKYALAASSLVMTLCFFALAVLWRVGGSVEPRFVRWAFLGIYAVFFMSIGVNQVSYNTLQGKLVAPTRRGRLLAAANLVGSVLAIALVIALLPHWLSEQGGRFDLIFCFTGICFGLATTTTLLLAEADDDYQEAPSQLLRLFGGVLETLSRDRNFFRLCIIGALFSMSVMLFPHYQALGRGERLSVPLHEIIWWVALQNAGTGLFSALLGPLADRYGNRAVLRLTLPALGAAPLLAVGLSLTGPAGRVFFPLVFVLVGLTPIILRTMHNYALEISPSDEHPRYLSTINLCMAIPIFASPLVGTLIDASGFDPVFIGVSILVLLGWMLTFGVAEPRHAFLPCSPHSETIIE